MTRPAPLTGKETVKALALRVNQMFDHLADQLEHTAPPPPTPIPTPTPTPVPPANALRRVLSPECFGWFGQGSIKRITAAEQFLGVGPMRWLKLGTEIVADASGWPAADAPTSVWTGVVGSPSLSMAPPTAGDPDRWLASPAQLAKGRRFSAQIFLTTVRGWSVPSDANHLAFTEPLLDRVLRGESDAGHRVMATRMAVAAKNAPDKLHVDLRIGSEMNWSFPPSLHPSYPSWPTLLPKWRAAVDRVFGIYRDVAAQTNGKLVVRNCFNPISSWPIELWAAGGPFDQLVPSTAGIVGLDFYDGGTTVQFDMVRAVAALAARKGLPFCLPEVGVMLRPSNPQGVGGDNPDFFPRLAECLAGIANFEYLCVFDSVDGNSGTYHDVLDATKFPRAKASLKALFDANR